MNKVASNGETNGFKLVYIENKEITDIILNVDQFERLELALGYIFNNEPILGMEVETNKNKN